MSDTYPTTNTQWTMQFALSDPVTTTIDPQFRFIEDNGWPNVELVASLVHLAMVR